MKKSDPGRKIFIFCVVPDKERIMKVSAKLIGILILILSSFFAFSSLNWGIKGIDPSWLQRVNPIEFSSFNPDEPTFVYTGYQAYFLEKMDPVHFTYGATGIVTISALISKYLLVSLVILTFLSSSP